MLVAPDTIGYSDYYARLVREGVFSDFVNNWLDRSRDSLAARYVDFPAFESGFEVSDPLVEALKTEGEQRGIAFDAAGYAASETVLRTQLKALAAQRLFGVDAYFRILNPVLNGAYIEAMSILSDWDGRGKPLLEPKK